MTVEDKGKLINPLKGSQVQSTIFQWVFTQCTVTVALLNCGMKAMSALLLPLSILGLWPSLWHYWIVMQPLAPLHNFVQFHSCAVFSTLMSFKNIVPSSLTLSISLKGCHVLRSILVLASPHPGSPWRRYTLQGLDGIAPRTTGS